MKSSRGRNEEASAPGRAPSEAATLVCAVTLAVALGVGCGVWINAHLASAASVAFRAYPAPAHLMPVASTAKTASAPSGVAEAESAGSQETVLAAAVDAPAHGSDEVPEAREARVSASESKSRSRPPAGAAISAKDETVRSEKPAQARGGGAESKARQNSVAPCALYASAATLTVRDGGAAGLVIGGPSEREGVTVTTPDWADIAVFPEGLAGRNGWVRYSVRSVSRKPGVYAVRLKTPCGSQNIPVTVVK
jgi:hypothetical protein